MKRLKIAVVGAGGVGGYLAAKLMQKDLADVKLFARGRHLETIEANGLEVEESGECFTVHPDTSVPKNGEIFDVVFLCVKSYDFKSACESVREHTNSETLIVPISNGVGHGEEITRYLHEGIVCDGCVYVISHVSAPGKIVKKGANFYLIFGAEVITEKMRRLAEVLNESGLKTKLSAQAKYDCWKKYLFIATFASLTSYHKKPMDQVWKEHEAEVHELLSEIRKVANALGVPVSDEDIAKVLKQAQNLPEGSKTSMQLDFEAGKKTELESLSGYIVREGEKAGVETPLMRKIYDLLSAAEKIREI